MCADQTLCFSKVRSHRAVMLLHLCVALTLGHTFFLMGKNENKKMLHVIESGVSFFSIAILMSRDAAFWHPYACPSVVLVRKNVLSQTASILMRHSVDRYLSAIYPYQWVSEFIFRKFSFFFLCLLFTSVR